MIADHRMAELSVLVNEMVDDVDAAAKFGSLPFTGDELRAYCRDYLTRFGLTGALAEARTRYAAQVNGKLLPLTHRPARRHQGILPGPTRGYQPPTWGYLLELLVQEGSIAVTEDQQLLQHDADELADRMVLRTDTIVEGFAWLVRHDLVVVRTTAEGRFASPDLAALQGLLRGQQELERAGARGPDVAALRYFRSRHVMVGLPWIGHALGEEGE